MEKQAIAKLLRQLHHGTLQLTYWDGETITHGKGAPAVVVRINKRSVLRKIIRSPSLALGEAYMNGDIELESPIEDFVAFAQANPLHLSGGTALRYVTRLNRNKKSKQAGQIAHHYDLGNDFYKLWLDGTMSYSCAYFNSPRDSLETAQTQKTEHILRKLQLRPGMKLLDIGSGWGYLLVTAAKKYKISGVGVSLSKEQVQFAQALAKREGVSHKVKFRYQNYQDIPKNEIFDRIVSVGFFEHVGRRNLATYFTVLDHHLKPEGISVLHAITHQDEVASDAWIDKYIFPGGYLPSVRETTYLIAEHGFQLFDYENLGQHYGITIEKWWHAYERHKNKVIDMYDERFYRMWRLYLIGAMMTFKGGNANLSQWTFKKGKSPAWPLTRSYLYK